jgi:ammonia channel protein AmtB
VLTLDINNVAQEEEEAMKMLLVLGVHNPQSLPVMFGAFVSRIKRNTMIIFLFLYVILFLYTLICHYMHET